MTIPRGGVGVESFPVNQPHVRIYGSYCVYVYIYMAVFILFLYTICTQSRQDSETIMARDGMHAPPEVGTELAELNPDQTGSARTEKPIKKL